MKLAQEHLIKDEDQRILKVLEIVRRSLEKSYPRGRILRRFHPKSIGLVEAEFTVMDNIPESMKTGLFKRPATYKAWIRFSNASPKVSRDARRTPRGMAIKVLNVSIEDSGITQDFVLTTNEILFPGTIGLHLYSLKGMFGNFLYLIPIFLNPLWWRGIFSGMKKSPNVLEEIYFSATPYLLGEGNAVKWHVKPMRQKISKMPNDPEYNFLTQRLSSDLKAGAATFEFFAQPQTDTGREPIENSSVRWKSPLIKLATLTIPSQHFDTKERRTLSERMRFSPWNCLPEHRPLGGNNRVRRILYEELARLRNGSIQRPE
jgi:hypothetical protein